MSDRDLRNANAKKIFDSQCDSYQAILLELQGLVSYMRQIENAGRIRNWQHLDTMVESLDLLMRARRYLGDSVAKF